MVGSQVVGQLVEFCVDELITEIESYLIMDRSVRCGSCCSKKEKE